MHELSLAGSILQMVEQAAQREGFVQVASLRLEVGALAGVEVPALRFALEAIAPGTCLDGAAINIDEPAGRAWCAACTATVPLTRRGDACPRCGGFALQPSAGAELRLVELIVHDPAHATVT